MLLLSPALRLVRCVAGRSLRVMPRGEFQYKKDHPIEKRAAEAARIREK